MTNRIVMNQVAGMDTRRRLITLVDYSIYYGEDKTIDDVMSLIKDIPSLSLMNYISEFNIQLYLKDDDAKIQFNLIDSLLGVQEKTVRDNYVRKVQELGNENRLPIFFYRYSNYKFYDLIFKSFNNKDCRDLTPNEKLKFFHAYLIINSLVNNEIDFNSSDFKEATESGEYDPLIITNFMYQRDFDTNMELRNQLMRGVCLFDFLDKHPVYSPYMVDYYSQKNATHHLEIFKTVLCSAVLTNFTNDEPTKRVQVITIDPDMASENIINLKVLDLLCINDYVKDYESSGGLKLLWTKPLYKINNLQYYVLDINFLINQLYKSQSFEFSSFVRKNYGDENFPSIKGKEFSEEIYLKALVERSFPHYKWLMGEDVKINNDEELCDVYIRDINKIALIEFKDVSLNDKPKSEKIVKKTLSEIDKKFFANEKGKAKGISQLANAIDFISKNNIPFDNDTPKDLVIYPIVIYTDNALGMDGINYLYRSKFKFILEERGISLNVKDVTFINLTHWEDHEHFFSEKELDLFDLLDEYSNHVSIKEYAKTPFEIFSRFYLNKINSPELYSLKFYDEIKEKVFKYKS